MLLLQLQDKTNKGAVRRNIVRIYQTCPIPEEIEGEIYELAMHFMLDYKEAIAIRSFSMRICDRISRKYPELISELLDAIRSILPGANSGLKNRGQNTIQDLTKKMPH
ncbi:MAG: hypothetical protein ACJA19_000238 [Bacteroidia bacterium]|jgi:hypothetical protein